MIKEMIADGLIKALPKQKFQNFVNIIGMVDIREWLTKKKQLENLQDSIKVRQKDVNEVIIWLTYWQT